MRLNDRLITTFKYNEIEYNIDLSFDNVLDVFDVLNDKDLRMHEQVEICLELLIGQSGDIELWDYIYNEFIHIETKQAIEYDLKGNPLPVQEDDRRVLDLEQDAEYIYASFIQAYNINLLKEHGKLHWHEFKALLNGLPSDTIMQRIIQIRLYEPSKHDSSEYKKTMRDLQNAYSLED